MKVKIVFFTIASIIIVGFTYYFISTISFASYKRGSNSQKTMEQKRGTTKGIEDVDGPHNELERETDNKPSTVNLRAPETVDGHDNELVIQKVQLITQNQETSRSGYFLKAHSNTRDNDTVTSTGMPDEAETIWQAHYTLDNNHQLVVILENKKYSRHTGQICVLGTRRDNLTGYHYPCVKKIDTVPTRLSQMDPTVTFYKKLKSPGSEMVYLESAMKSNRRLLVGFNSSGQPLPMEDVKEFTFLAEAYFRVIGHIDR